MILKIKRSKNNNNNNLITIGNLFIPIESIFEATTVRKLIYNSNNNYHNIIDNNNNNSNNIKNRIYRW